MDEEETLLMIATIRKTYSQQLVETKECKSPCPSSEEMCIALCA